MTLEEKAINAFNIISEDYSSIITLESLGLYHRLVWLARNIFKDKAISYAYILDDTHLTEQSLDKNITILEAVGMIRRLENKNSFEVILDIKELDEKEKIKFVEELCSAGIIQKADRQRQIDEIARRAQFREQRKRSALEAQEFDLSAVKRPNAPVNIVRYYYSRLSKTFGGVYISHNEKREAQVLGDLMKKWGDTPELTRQMLDLMVDDAKTRNRFEEVSSMALYGHKRNWAHYRLKNPIQS